MSKRFDVNEACRGAGASVAHVLDASAPAGDWQDFKARWVSPSQLHPLLGLLITYVYSQFQAEIIS